MNKLQQRIETLESFTQRSAEKSIGLPDEDGALPIVDDAILSSVQRWVPLSVRMTMVSSLTSLSTIQRPVEPSQGSTIQNQSIMDPSLYLATSPRRRELSVLALGDDDISPQNPRGRSPSFYGATSHPHVTSPGGQSHVSRIEGSDFVGIDLDPASPHLRHQLLESFFRYQTLWVDVVNRDVFLCHQKDRQDSRWYSEFLENVMLACGTRLSTSQTIRTLGHTYFGTAKTQALGAMSEPTPANLQGFLLLSEYEVTKGNDRPGWMYCG